jgi:hypothetical protein
MAGWRFLTLPKKHGQEIKKKLGKYARGWGSAANLKGTEHEQYLVGRQLNHQNLTPLTARQLVVFISVYGLMDPNTRSHAAPLQRTKLTKNNPARVAAILLWPPLQQPIDSKYIRKRK